MVTMCITISKYLRTASETHDNAQMRRSTSRAARDTHAECLSSRIAKAAENYLVHSFRLARAGTIVDWNKVAHASLKLADVSDEVAFQWSLSTLAGQCRLGLLLLTPDKPCLTGTFEFMLRHFDELALKAPGCRILFRAIRTAARDVDFTRGIIEFNGRGELFAAV